MHIRRTLHLVVAAGLLGATSCSSVREMDLSAVPQVTIDDLGAKIRETLEDRGAVVVHLREGDAIPLRMTIDSPVGRLEAGENVVHVARDVWLYISRTEARISPDGRRWVDFGDFSGMKDLFGLKGGRVEVGFRATEAEGAAITLDIEGR